MKKSRQPTVNREPNNLSSYDGFTLIELIMVIVIIGILAFVAIQKYPTSEISLETAADMIRSDIRSVQALAMAGHKVSTIFTPKILTFGSNIYTFDDLSGTKTRNLANIFDAQLTISAPATIGFNSLGEPTKDQDDTITINGTRTLTVLQYTGRVDW
jgi:prepilin-type N-terminal cleavage/methylation domain-containing protein